MTGGAEDQEEEGSEEVGPSLSLAIQEVYYLAKINPSLFQHCYMCISISSLIK